MIVIDGKIKARPAPDKPLPYEINIAVVEEKSIKIEGGVARASAKTSQRLIRIQFKDGKWSVEGGGAESTPRDIVKPKAAKALPSPPKK